MRRVMRRRGLRRRPRRFARRFRRGRRTVLRRRRVVRRGRQSGATTLRRAVKTGSRALYSRKTTNYNAFMWNRSSDKNSQGNGASAIGTITELDFNTRQNTLGNLFDVNAMRQLIGVGTATGGIDGTYRYKYGTVDWMRIEILARPTLLSTIDVPGQVAGTTVYPMQGNTPDLECYWLPNENVDDTTDQSPTTSSANTSIVMARARRDTRGLYRYVIYWRNTLPKNLRCIPIAQWDSSTLATPFPYGVQQYFAKLQTYDTPLAGTNPRMEMAAAGFPPSMILRFPYFRVMCPGANNTGKPSSVNVSFSYNVTGRFIQDGKFEE
nr:MAG: capsid protein [Circoviridae sp.]